MTKKEAIERLKQNKAAAYFHAGMVQNTNVIENELKDIEAMNMAIEALQRGIPKNPIINFVADSDGARRLNDGWTEDSYLCPVCHTYFGEVFDEGYCRKCGQKLIQKRIRLIKE